jgi:glycosyltransferase involved in cell wall biosynthesis
VTLSVVIITFDEESNLRRTLESVRGLADEIVVVDSGSTDRTLEIAREFGARVFVEPWKGFAAQKNSALEKATCDWILSLDADEAVSEQLAKEIAGVIQIPSPALPQGGYLIARKNLFLGRWMKHGGFYPDRKLRLFRRGAAQFENRLVHEDAKANGPTGTLQHPLLHDAYPTLDSYLDHMNKYSALGARMALAQRPRGFNLINIYIRPQLTFFYNYIVRLGFLDGREGLLLHLYHAVYVSWKYAKAWELSRSGARSGLGR